MTSIKRIFIILWAYFSELILTGLLYGLIFLLLDLDQIISFFIKASDNLASKYTAIMLAGSIAFFWSFYSHSNTNFAKWLYHKMAFNNYVRVFLTAIAIFLITTISLVITQITQNRSVALVSGGLFILSVLNVYSFFKNIVDIMKLNIVFNIEIEKEKQKTK